MLKNKNQLVVALAAAALSSSALADGGTFVARPYLGLDLGYANVDDSRQKMATALVSLLGGTAAVTQDKYVFSGRLFAGYKVTENIDVEIGYLKTNDVNTSFNGVSSGAVAYTGSANINFSGFDYSALIRPSISSGYNNLYFRFGGTNWDTKSSLTINGNSVSISTSENTSGAGLQYGIGYDSDIATGLKSRVAFTHYDKVSGVSGNSVDMFSVGIIKDF